ncbi:MAG: hypothetical protein ABJD97_07730 [Betaproteobacteria bacterium]
MNRAAFEYVYLHANALAELAFLRALAGVAAAPPADYTADQLADNAAQADRMMHLGADEIDWAALEGLDDAPAPAAAAPVVAEAPAVTLPGFSETMDAAGLQIDDGPPDVAAYLATVERARAALQARVDDGVARADLAALDAAVATLPADLAPLAGPLAESQFMQWLNLHEARHAGLAAVVTEIRKLEPFG